MIRIAALAALAPVTAMAHAAEVPHTHGSDPSLYLGLGMLTILAALALYLKRRRA
ncbi:MAG: LPXTG cell wall anchor domain-containing protein [Marinibacterium sp.]